jgi:hypothetical protein
MGSEDLVVAAKGESRVPLCGFESHLQDRNGASSGLDLSFASTVNGFDSHMLHWRKPTRSLLKCGVDRRVQNIGLTGRLAG